MRTALKDQSKWPGNDQRRPFFNTAGEGLPGDANEDGAVDFADLNLVVSFFNTAAPANVPAPGALTLAALGLGVGVRRRRGRGH